MVHGWGWVFIEDRLPRIAFQAEVKYYWRRFGTCPIQSHARVVIDYVASACEVGFSFFVTRACGNSISGCSRMGWKLAPGDLLWVFAVNLAHPAFIRGNVAGPLRGATRLSSIHINNGVADDCSSMSKNRWSRVSGSF